MGDLTDRLDALRNLQGESAGDQLTKMDRAAEELKELANKDGRFGNVFDDILAAEEEGTVYGWDDADQTPETAIDPDTISLTDIIAPYDTETMTAPEVRPQTRGHTSTQAPVEDAFFSVQVGADEISTSFHQNKSASYKSGMAGIAFMLATGAFMAGSLLYTQPTESIPTPLQPLADTVKTQVNQAVDGFSRTLDSFTFK